MSKNEFIIYYETYKKCPNDLLKPKHKLNVKQLQTRYEKYLKSIEKKELAQQRLYEKQKDKGYVQDEKWLEIRSKVYLRDKFQCRFISCLTGDEYSQFIKQVDINAFRSLVLQLDPAHIYPKGSYPHMKYDIDNIVTMNRFSHSLLDQFKNPLDGKPITNEERLKWFERIVGRDVMETLLTKSKKRNIDFLLTPLD